MYSNSHDTSTHGYPIVTVEHNVADLVCSSTHAQRKLNQLIDIHAQIFVLAQSRHLQHQNYPP
jgi:hypothetical protein